MKNKFNNRTVEGSNLKFASKREALVYLELKELEEKGLISGLKLQVPFTFEVNGKPLNYVESRRQIKYIADFTFLDSKKNLRVWDAKGVRTQVFLMKKALMFHVNGIEIEEK